MRVRVVGVGPEAHTVRQHLVEAKLKLNKDYTDKFAFAKKCWMNMASAGKFSSDRTISDYAKEIWMIDKVVL